MGPNHAKRLYDPSSRKLVMTHCHVAVSTADTSQQGNFKDAQVILKALFKTAELGHRSVKSLAEKWLCGRPAVVGDLSPLGNSLCRRAAASPAIHGRHLGLTTDSC